MLANTVVYLAVPFLTASRVVRWWKRGPSGATLVGLAILAVLALATLVPPRLPCVGP